MKLLSPPGLAGIAILAIEPRERAAVLAALETPAGRPSVVEAGQPPVRAVLRLGGRVVDDVLLVCPGPGELEVHVHGAPAVIEQLDRQFGITVAVANSAADRLLREALSVEQFDLAVEQRRYDFAGHLATLRAMPLAQRKAAVAAALERSRIARAMVVPQRVVLVGRQNAGKSSLFNHLLFRERALTGATPGLTRDAIAEVTTLAGYPYELVDTAGVGMAASLLDAEAIAKGVSWRQGALLVLVVDGTVGPASEDRELAPLSALLVSSKSDLPAGRWPTDIRRDAEFSTRLAGPQTLRRQLGELLAERRALAVAGAVGGFAALQEAQWQQLIALDADCSGGDSPA